MIGQDSATAWSTGPLAAAAAHTAGPPAIEVTDFVKSYGAVQAVKGISFDVAQGEIFGFLGPNGAGKSTTIRAMLDLIRPTSGTIRVLGLDARHDTQAIHRRIGYVPGEVRFPRGLTGRQLLNRYSRMQGLQPILLDQLIERFEVEVERPVQGYSKGMRQKIALVQAFNVRDLASVILDEPTSGLDPLSQRAFNAFLLDEVHGGRTIFMSSHIISDVEKTCRRVGVIRAGALVAVERIEVLRQRAGQKVTVEFGAMERPAGLEALRRVPGVVDVTVSDHGVVTGDGLGTVTITVQGSVDPLIKTLARYEVIHLSAEEAPLEEVFLQFYETPAAPVG